MNTWLHFVATPAVDNSMQATDWVTLIASLLAVLGVAFGTVRSGRSAEKVAHIGSTAEAYSTAATIYKDAIDELQAAVTDMRLEIGTLRTDMAEANARNAAQEKELGALRRQVADLDEELAKSTKLLRSAAGYISKLLAFIQLHAERDDIPPVPEELDGVVGIA